MNVIRTVALSIPLRGLLFIGLCVAVSQQAHAVPILQLYLEGGVYNHATESWELTPVGSSSGEPFRLWVIGNVDGEGGKGPIYDVRLTISESDLEGAHPQIDLVGSRSDGYRGLIYDQTTAPDPVQNLLIRTSHTTPGFYDTADDVLGVVTDGSSPVLSDGKILPSHDQYGDGVFWQEFSLGDFGVDDEGSPVDVAPDSLGDFIDAFPDESEITHNAGQINVYEVSVTGGHGLSLHFDAYDSIQGKNKARAVFAHFSHDAHGEGGVDATANIVPEPSALVVCGGLLLCLAGVRFWRRG